MKDPSFLRISEVFGVGLIAWLVGCASPIKERHFREDVIRSDYALIIDEERVRLTKDYFRLHHPEVFRQMPPPDDVNSITFTPRLIVVHATHIKTLKETVAYFMPNTIHPEHGMVAQNGALNVGVQFLVDRDGSIFRSYPETVMARHVIGLNHVAIGIENVGNADLSASKGAGVVPLTKAQVEANIALIRYLLKKYPTIKRVIAHSDYRALEDPNDPDHDLFYEALPEYRTEKVDPGPRFMKALRKGLGSGLGLWGK